MKLKTIYMCVIIAKFAHSKRKLIASVQAIYVVFSIGTANYV